VSRIEAQLASIREDRRADYLFDTKAASAAVGCHPNKFHDWWYRTRDKLIALAESQPGETAAELAALIAVGVERREKNRPP
jgi:hypothetical protein